MTPRGTYTNQPKSHYAALLNMNAPKNPLTVQQEKGKKIPRFVVYIILSRKIAGRLGMIFKKRRRLT